MLRRAEELASDVAGAIGGKFDERPLCRSDAVLFKTRELFPRTLWNFAREFPSFWLRHSELGLRFQRREHSFPSDVGGHRMKLQDLIFRNGQEVR
jgi:hypothetical protein